MNNNTPKYYAYYIDDGPNVICGQILSITSKWRRLYTFSSYKDFRLFADEICKTRARKNARIAAHWDCKEITHWTPPPDKDNEK